MKENTSIRLKKIMNERGLKQVDIIKKCKPYCEKYNVKLNKNYLSQYVSGKVEPGQKTLSILAMALDVNEAWLMGYDVPRDISLLPQSDESPVLNMIYNDPALRNSDKATHFLFKKLAESYLFDLDVVILLREFEKLNQEGKKEAINRLSELTFIPKYTNDNSSLDIVAEEPMPYNTHSNTKK